MLRELASLQILKEIPTNYHLSTQSHHLYVWAWRYLTSLAVKLTWSHWWFLSTSQETDLRKVSLKWPISCLEALNLSSIKASGPEIYAENFMWTSEVLFCTPHSISDTKSREIQIKLTDVSNLGTLHVVASFILLYWRLTAGARLRVGHKPETIGRVLKSFLRTRHWHNEHQTPLQLSSNAQPQWSKVDNVVSTRGPSSG